jgi:hypothetical protein
VTRERRRHVERPRAPACRRRPPARRRPGPRVPRVPRQRPHRPKRQRRRLLMAAQEIVLGRRRLARGGDAVQRLDVRLIPLPHVGNPVARAVNLEPRLNGSREL